MTKKRSRKYLLEIRKINKGIIDSNNRELELRQRNWPRHFIPMRDTIPED